jgi:hypothetical protein
MYNLDFLFNFIDLIFLKNLKQEQVLMPYLNALSKFRDDIRVEARATKRNNIILDK